MGPYHPLATWPAVTMGRASSRLGAYTHELRNEMRRVGRWMQTELTSLRRGTIRALPMRER
jgi:hypothetical protein